MKRSRTALAVTLFAQGMVAGCGGYQTSIQSSTGATIISLSPSAMPAGQPAGVVPNPACPTVPTTVQPAYFCLTVNANSLNGFPTNSVVQWNGKNLVTVFQDTATLLAEVPYTLIAKQGTAYVNTYSPQSGAGMNGLSNALAFAIYGAPNPVPALTSISPNTATACSSKCAGITITLAGSNFLPSSQNGGSKVTYTGVATLQVETAITITSYSSTELKATIPGSYLSADDVAKINVINPPSAICVVNCPNLGGGDTNDASLGPVTTQTFTITGAAAANAASAVAEETPTVSQDGRYVAYASIQNGNSEILLRDTCVGAANGCTPFTRTLSVASDGTAGNDDSHNASMTADARYVAFSSAATNLLENTPAGRQIYLHDTCIGAPSSCKPSTLLISTDEEGKLTGTESILPSVSASGRFVAFVAITPSHDSKTVGATSASAPTTPNSGLRQVFVRDTCLGTANCTPKTTRISMVPGDSPANSSKPAGPALSGLAKQMALTDGKSATVFTPTVPVDERVFLAIPNEQR